MVRGQWASLARMPRSYLYYQVKLSFIVIPLHVWTFFNFLFSKDILGFLMTTESQDLGLTSHPKDGAF